MEEPNLCMHILSIHMFLYMYTMRNTRINSFAIHLHELNVSNIVCLCRTMHRTIAYRTVLCAFSHILRHACMEGNNISCVSIIPSVFGPFTKRLKNT